jgi:WhiB family redox-sensing transcriptional regulator
MSQSWRAQAECIGTTPDLFFPPYDLPKAKRFHLERMAKSICADCSVRIECLEFSIRAPLQTVEGIWGGKNEKERRAIRRKVVRQDAST